MPCSEQRIGTGLQFLALINTLKQTPSLEADSRSADQGISHLLWIPKAYYHVRKSPPLVYILSQMNLVHTITPYFFKINFNIIRSSTPRSSK
jgi:hypothetical protein